MRSARNIVFSVLAVFVVALSAAAHPLGNFSINQYSGIEVSPTTIKIRQVLDMAEIPTFQAAGEIDTDKNGEFSQEELNTYAAAVTSTYLPNLHLSVGGNPVKLTAASIVATTEPGAGDLPILKIVWDLSGPLDPTSQPAGVTYENANYRERVGWNEIVVRPVSGISVFDSTAFSSGLSDELRRFPQESLTSPLNERDARFTFTAGSPPEGAKPLLSRDGRQATPIEKDRLAELISVPEITPAIALLGLLLAFGLGALHAMSPGHGKTVVGAYLVGSRGTPRHAAFLGLTVTITHTLGVFALGLITLFASNYILPEKLMPFLSFVSGLLVFYIGITLFKNRLFSAFGWAKSDHHDHSHADGGSTHAHGDLTHTHDGTTHTHAPPETITWKSLLALGISGGLLPCPSALVLMLSAISLGRVGYGLILTVVFSLGLAATLTGFGLLFLYVGKAFGGSRLGESRLVKTLPVFSALVIACIGAVICYNSLWQR